MRRKSRINLRQWHYKREKFETEIIQLEGASEGWYGVPQDNDEFIWMIQKEALYHSAIQVTVTK